MVLTMLNSLEEKKTRALAMRTGWRDKAKSCCTISRWYFFHFFPVKSQLWVEKVNILNDITLFQLSLPLSGVHRAQVHGYHCDYHWASPRNICWFWLLCSKCNHSRLQHKSFVSENYSKSISVWEMKKIIPSPRRSQRGPKIITRFSTPQALRRGANTP